MDLTAQVEQLQREVDSLRAAFSLFEGLVTPRMAKLYQQMIGGLVATASNSDWRMHGFYPVEQGSDALDVAWTQFDQNVAIYMLLLKGESYSCALRLIRTPHIEAPGSIVVRVNGKEMQPNYDEDEQAYTFRVRADRTGWYLFSFNSRKCLQPSLHGSQDLRRLGVLFQSLSLVPIIA
jgi:hypothetical protein